MILAFLSAGDETEIPCGQNEYSLWEGGDSWWGYYGDTWWGVNIKPYHTFSHCCCHIMNIILLTFVILCLFSWDVYREEPLAVQICSLWNNRPRQWLSQSCRGQQCSSLPLKFDLRRRLPGKLLSGTTDSRGRGGQWSPGRTEPVHWCSRPKLIFLWGQQEGPQGLHREPVISIRRATLALCLPSQTPIQPGTPTAPVLSIYRGAPHGPLSQGSLPNPQTHS